MLTTDQTEVRELAEKVPTQEFPERGNHSVKALSVHPAQAGRSKELSVAGAGTAWGGKWREAGREASAGPCRPV